MLDLSRVREIAKEYSCKRDFVKGAESAYRWALRRGLLALVCEHMARPRQRSKWTMKMVRQIALSYKTKKDFRKGHPGAYRSAYKTGVLDEICRHMEIVGNKYRRAIYIYEFESNKVYIGLTYDYHKRHLQHQRNGPVCREAAVSKYKYIRKNEWLTAAEAQAEEIRLIEEYRRAGWKLLNSVKGGALGGSDLIWTNELLRQEALKYNTLDEFRKKSASAYAIASQKRILGSFDHLKREREFWDIESVKGEAKKYASRTEFTRKAPGAASWAWQNGLMDLVCAHMGYERKYWDMDNVAAEAKKYKSRSEFQRNAGSAWMWAHRNNCLDRVTAHMVRPKKETKWTIETVRRISEKFSSKSEFRKMASGPYQWAKKMGVLEEVCNYAARPRKWTYQTVKNTALKYQTRNRFAKGNQAAYQWARKNGLLDEICRHMDSKSR